jgi:hypothetical protein
MKEMATNNNRVTGFLVVVRIRPRFLIQVPKCRIQGELRSLNIFIKLALLFSEFPVD